MSALRRIGMGLTLLTVAGGLGVAVVDGLHNPFFNDLPWFSLAYLALTGLLLRRARGLALTTLLVAAVWLAGALHRPSGPSSVDVLVYGVDGGTFDVIDTYAEELPAFTQLRADGTRAVLRSIEPMFSPPLWTSIASGRKADDHGIRGFRVQASDCKVARFWDVAEEHEWRIGLYKWLVDYPPRQVQGFWVPSWLAPSTETWPESLGVVKEIELARRIRRKQTAATRSNVELGWALIGSGGRLSTLLDAALWVLEEKLLPQDLVRASIRQQIIRGNIDRDVFVAQLYTLRPRLATFNYYATDGLAHRYWDRHLAGGDEVRVAYRQADQILAELRSHLGPQARLIVVSDHGFQAMEQSGKDGNYAPTTERLRLRLGETVGPVDVTRVGRRLTVAFQTHDQRVKGETWISELRDQDGAPVFVQDAHPENQLTIGLNLAIEMINAEVLERSTVGGEPMRDWVTLSDSFTGTHHAAGIFYAAGPGVTPGEELPTVELLQVAPTVLAAMGLPAADDMPEKAVIFPELPRVASWDQLVLGLTWLGGEAGVNDDRLKQLGYQQ